MEKILVAEISGKRPGTAKDRPTEKFNIKYDKVIISNNSEGYTTDWEIINVPESYQNWYIENCKMSDSAWYAPMNRSYAIQYAKQNGYRYLIQLDDNIEHLEIMLAWSEEGILYKYRASSNKGDEMCNDYIDTLVHVLKNTNAGMSGCALSAVGLPDDIMIAERYCYSFFALDLKRCPPHFSRGF